MIRALLLCLLVAGSVSLSYSQTTLSFCASVEKDGYCAFNNTKFFASPDSGQARLYMLISNPVGLGLSHITFKLFTVDKDGKETFINSLDQDLGADWRYAWKIGFFTAPGKYNIKVVNDADPVVCSKAFELFDR
jgi:hypothetical protein